MSDPYKYNFLNIIRLGFEQTFSNTETSKKPLLKLRKTSGEKESKYPKGFFLEKEKTKRVITLEGQSARFTAYAPKLFFYFRNLQGISPRALLMSLCSKPLLSMSGESGKSGMSFYTSHDSRFVIKTLVPKESAFLLTLLKSYISYFAKNRHSLLSSFYGLFKVTFLGQSSDPNDAWAPLAERKIFVVMDNVFASKIFSPMLSKFDLKGTTEDRYVQNDNNTVQDTVIQAHEAVFTVKKTGKEVLPEEKPGTQTKKVNKDINFELENREIRVSENFRVLLVEQVRRDVEFLTKHKIMDYSFLVGIEETEEKPDAEFAEQLEVLSKPLLKDKDGFESVNVFRQDEGGLLGQSYEKQRVITERYFVGIIDILQPYNFFKKTAHQYKKQIKYAFTNVEIDTVRPTVYSHRFIKYILGIITCDENQRRRSEYMTDTIKEGANIRYT